MAKKPAWQHQILADVRTLVADDSVRAAWNDELRQWCAQEANAIDQWDAEIELWEATDKKRAKKRRSLRSRLREPRPLRDPLPLPDRDPADDLDRLALLAAFHNAHANRRPFKLYPPLGECSLADNKASACFSALVERLRVEGSKAFAEELQQSLIVARGLIESNHRGSRTTRRSGKRGTPPIYDAQSDAKLLRDWKAAKRHGLTRKEFCRERGTNQKSLIKAQGRERKRKANRK